MTGGALSCQWIMLTSGASGAAPHHLDRSSEMFYVASGAADLLADGRVLYARQGDLALFPPGTVHAFAAAPGSDADQLIMITPGFERFGYFRHLEWIAKGHARPESILEVRELYDNYFDQTRSGSDSRRPGSQGPPQSQPASRNREGAVSPAGACRG